MALTKMRRNDKTPLHSEEGRMQVWRVFTQTRAVYGRTEQSARTYAESLGEQIKTIDLVHAGDDSDIANALRSADTARLNPDSYVANRSGQLTHTDKLRVADLWARQGS